jgi:hypothetical protein
MNQQNAGLEAFLQKINQISRGTIIVSSQPSLDIMAAGLSLYLGFRKSNKDFRIVCPTPTTVGFSHLVGVDKVAQKMSGKSLVISFEYHEEAIDKISYNIENDRFNLVVQPKPGADPLPTKNVSYSHTGEPGLVLVCGALSLTDLGSVYDQNRDVFEKSDLVSFSVGQTADFGQPRLTFSQTSSYSEGALSILRGGNIAIDEDIATNILFGIHQATQGLAIPGLAAETFEAVAYGVKVGGIWPTEFGGRQIGKPQRVGDFEPMPANESAARPPSEIEAKEEIVEAPKKQEGTQIGAKKWEPKFPTEGRKF